MDGTVAPQSINPIFSCNYSSAANPDKNITILDKFNWTWHKVSLGEGFEFLLNIIKGHALVTNYDYFVQILPLKLLKYKRTWVMKVRGWPMI